MPIKVYVADERPVFDAESFARGILQIRKPQYIIYSTEQGRAGMVDEDGLCAAEAPGVNAYPVLAILPPVYPEWLGGMDFTNTHQVRFPYAGGAMARGIASAEMVIALARHGMLGFFGAAGLGPARLEAEISKISRALDPDHLSWGSNLIHSPGNPLLEEETIDLYLKYKVKRISAAAFMNVTPGIVRYVCKGLYRDADGRIKRKHYVFAKISRPEVVRHFLAPAPEAVVDALLSRGQITEQEAEWVRQIPVCEDIDVEGDSGGHTDNRPLGPLFSSIALLREEMVSRYAYKAPIRLGAAGGLGTPEAIASAFAMGAAYAVVGSVHQSAVEAGTSAKVKDALSKAGIADTIMTPSADMFELGAKVQVLKLGTMMGARGNRLYELHKNYSSIEAIPERIRKEIEDTIFGASLEEVWKETVNYFEKTDPAQIRTAEKNPRHKMALVFRWYLGNSSHWPISGEEKRSMDYQIWCGPAMGAFNQWVKGSFLEEPENRSVGQIALNLLEGAAVVTRMNQIRSLGIPIPCRTASYRPEVLAL